MAKNNGKSSKTLTHTLDNDKTAENVKDYKMDDKRDGMMTCEPCQNQGIKVEASHFCYHCDEKYCDECCYRHKAHSRTKMHEIFYLGTFEPVKHKCASCAYSEDDKAAFFHCTDCNDYLCLNCQKYHKYQKQTREHHVSQICNFLTCYSCLSIGQQISAKTYCKDCEDELLCEPCSKRHLSSKTSKGHKLSKDMSKYKLRLLKLKKEAHATAATEKVDEEGKRPGRPYTADIVHSNSLVLQWDELLLGQNDAYQVMLKDVKGKWRTFRSTTKYPKIGIDGLQPNTAYIFRVRVVNDEEGTKGPFSPESEPIQTRESPACAMMKISPLVYNAEIPVHELPLQEDKKARNDWAKTRKMFLGDTVDNENDVLIKCEPCEFRDIIVKASHFCAECDEKYCDDCTKRHKAHPTLKDHDMVDLETIEPPKKICDPCAFSGDDKTATYYCAECDEYLCQECQRNHKSLKQTRGHNVSEICNFLTCHSCLSIGEQIPARAFCEDCEDELLCEPCSKRHLSTKKSKDHKLSEDMLQYKLRMKKLKKEESDTPAMEQANEEGKRPGRPYTADIVHSNSLVLQWDELQLGEKDAYQVMLKDVKGKWRTFRSTTKYPKIGIDGLQSNTSYKFKVRVVNDEEGTEGPFSPESEPIQTGESPACAMMKISPLVYNAEIPVHALPLLEDKKARNELAKTRKMFLGSKDRNPFAKNVMIVGATGSGKSTLVNAMANYIMGVTWEDPFRFTLVNVETDEQQIAGDQAHSQTQWITCYTIYQTVSNRLPYTINLIDTPGFGNTRGIEHDQRIVKQIKDLFCANGDQGVTTIDAICFILKAPDARLTLKQSYIFESILSLFGNDIKDNMCTLVTFAEGQTPPVLASLEAMEHKTLPREQYFTFNNSALYVKNTPDAGVYAAFFWEMGMRSCKAFFDHLETLPSKSLLLSAEVLGQRERLENTIEHLYQEVDNGLSKIRVMEQEINIFTRYRRQIRENKDFKYNVQEIIKLSGNRQHTTNCLTCNFTCHESCAYADEKDMANCVSMRNDGTCSKCPDNCHWKNRKIYEDATQKLLLQEQILSEMWKDVELLNLSISDRMNQIADCNNRLKEITLRPDPMTVAQYLELLIESERREKKSGFQKEIDFLEKYKKKSQYEKSVKVFRDRLQWTRKNLHDTEEEGKRPGRPYTADIVHSNSLVLQWDELLLGQNDTYQVMLKDVKGKWRTFRTTTKHPKIGIDRLQSNTSYIFRVRVVNDEEGTEGPFSPESEPIQTRESPACAMMNISPLVYNAEIPVHALPLLEDKKARNDWAKTRKMFLGTKDRNPFSKNVMIVGATGSGKSTLVNAMANYIMGVTWEDPFRFTLVNVETDEQQIAGDQAHSQTQWITCYAIYQTVSNRLPYTINLIDTPGFGDTRGIEHDQRIVKQIKDLVCSKGDQGVTTIDAICFILRAPDARLTPTQSYIFESILSLFGNDIKDNICTLVTFADGQKPPVLASLEAMKHKTLPCEQYFTFNNSALYVKNTPDAGIQAPFFWEMGMCSCKAFFDHLETLPSKSLLLTAEVLRQRERLENTVENLYQEVDNGLSKIGVLEQEINIFTRYRRQIRENKDFKFNVTENVQEIIKLSGNRQHTTNCLTCNFTCHESCECADEKDMANCVSMRNDGTCSKCPGNCHWTQHRHSEYIIKLVPKKVTKTYSEKQKIYEDATQKLLLQEQILSEMWKDVELLNLSISDRMNQIADCNNRLKEITLRPDPMTVVQYLELLIESERREKKSGFQNRIDVLEKCKKKAQYGKSVQVFRDRLQWTRKKLHDTVNQDGEKESEKILEGVTNRGKKLFN